MGGSGCNTYCSICLRHISINLFPTLRRKSIEYSTGNGIICNACGGCGDCDVGMSCNFNWKSKMEYKFCKWKCLESREIVVYLLVYKLFKSRYNLSADYNLVLSDPLSLELVDKLTSQLDLHIHITPGVLLIRII